MNLLPILVREMRALCRKRGTYATRIALAIPVLLVWGLFALIPEVRGDSVLAIQAVVCQIFFAFGAALGASDAISSERRGGTLGLLLLTPLRSYQVLLGKLLTRISQFLLCLWAVVPILALPLLARGVGPSDVAKVIAGILAGCLLGMAIGLFASVICRSAFASACLSFAALLGCYLLPILIVGTLGSMGYFSPVPDFIWLGPIAVTHNVPGEFGSLTLNLSILGGLALLLLLLSMLLLLFLRVDAREEGGWNHSWQEVRPQDGCSPSPHRGSGESRPDPPRPLPPQRPGLPDRHRHSPPARPSSRRLLLLPSPDGDN